MTSICLATALMASFSPETLNENMPQDIIASNSLIISMRYTSLAKRACDKKANLYISLSQWNINEIESHAPT